MKHSRPFDVVVIGELNIDIILNDLNSSPEKGKEVFAQSLTTTLGSSSAIFASNLSTLGVRIAFVGMVGDDYNGDQIISLLKAKGIDVSGIIRKTGCSTGVTVVLNDDEDRVMVTYPGPMTELALEDIDERIFANARHLHLSSLFLQKRLQAQIVQLFRKAKSFGITTSLDPQWDPFEKWDVDWPSLLQYVDIFLPNESEVLAITSSESTDVALEKLRSFGHIIVVKKGREGAVLVSGDERIVQPAFLNESVVDSIGAGDSFDAGFVHQYLQKKPLNECLEFAALTGAINTTGKGGTGAFTDIEAVKNTAKRLFNYTL